MKNGNRREWDCTMLFYAILYSESVGPHLAPTVRKNVNDLRNFRNAQIAHITQGRLSDTDFQNAIGKVDVAFQALRLTTEKNQGIKNQATFLTEQLLNTLKNLQKKRISDRSLQTSCTKKCLHSAFSLLNLHTTL